jgi:hypothetical protein
MTFNLPEGYEAPDAEEFDVVATLRRNEDGTVTITEVEGMEVGDMEVGDMEDEAEVEVEIEVGESKEPGSVFERAIAAGIPMKE